MAVADPITFSSLPEDIHNLILSFIIRPKDLAVLCLVDQHIRTIAVRHLYREVTLDIGGPGDSRLSSLLSHSNPGLKHIRVLDLYNAPDYNCGQRQQAAFTVKLILDFLPRDILEKFRWHPWDVFSSENLVLLYKTQRKLERLEAVSLDKPFTEDLKKRLDFDSIVTDNVKTLGLYPDSKDALEFSRELLKRKQTLTKLTIGSNFIDEDEDDIDDDAEILSDLNDLATRPGRITSTLFRHLMPFDSCTAIHLEDLTLEKLYLRYSSSTYCKAIHMPLLKRLKVIECTAAGAFFAALCRSTLLPHGLQSLEVTHSDDSAEKELTKTLDEFLPLLSCLEELAIEVGGTNSLPSHKSIVRHGKTLRLLSLHSSSSRTTSNAWHSSVAGPDDELVYSTRDFDTICKACPDLRQLSIAMPRTSITATPSHPYSAFLGSIRAHLNRLVTLQISTWPTNNLLTSSPASRLPAKLYTHMLHLIAQDMFEYSADSDGASREHSPTDDHDDSDDQTTVGPPASTPVSSSIGAIGAKPNNRLRLVAFGTSDRDYDRAEKTQMVLFAKGKAVHPATGKENALAMRIGWNERRWWEPESEVLDWALQRGGKMPVLGSSDSLADDGEF